MRYKDNSFAYMIENLLVNKWIHDFLAKSGSFEAKAVSCFRHKLVAEDYLNLAKTGLV